MSRGTSTTTTPATGTSAQLTHAATSAQQARHPTGADAGGTVPRHQQGSRTNHCNADGCTKLVRARGLCSTHYNRRHQPNRHALASTDCVVCGAGLMRERRSDRRSVCSVGCRNVLVGHLGGSYTWADDAVTRAKAFGCAEVERFEAAEIFDRDDWTCYLCHLPVDRDADPLDRRAPTVDHVQPLSHGGTHTRSNARCACLSCNSRKSDLELDLLPL